MAASNLPLDDEQATKAAAGEGDVDAILSEARDRYQQSVSLDSDNRKQALDDLEFEVGNQWPEPVRRERELAKRPCLTINTLQTFLHQVTNDQRLNEPSIKIHAVDSNADIETAKVIQGMIRHIEYASNASVAYDTAVNSAASVGFGYFRLKTEYESDTSFDQVICFDRIRNCMSVRLDPLSKEVDGSDMKWAFVEEMMPREDFKAEYPDAEANNTQLLGQAPYAGWLTDKSVLVTDYYCIERKRATVCMLSDGTSGYKDELPDPLPEGVTVKRERESWRRKVMHRKITAVDILSEVEIKCKWIPVFPVYGDEVDINGRIVRSGIIRNAKDPARMYNVWMTAATEEVALRPKSKYVMAEGQEAGHEEEWKGANNSASPYITYKPVALGEVLAPPPRREPLADIPAGMLAMALHAKDNIKATTGLFDSSLGAKGTATSGKQEIAQQQQGDVANFHYSDNLAITIRHVGRCIVDMIPSYYDTARTVRILGMDGRASFAEINQKPDQTGELGAIEKVLHDVTVGKYDVTVSKGPSFSTMRQESSEFFANAMQAAKDPATAAVVSYLAIKNTDVPDGDTATEMMATLLPPQAKAVLDKDGQEGGEAPQPPIMTSRGPVPVEQAGMLLDQLAEALAQRDEQAKVADAAGAEADRLKAETALVDKQLELERVPVEQAEAQIRITEAETRRLTAEANLIRAQAEVACMPDKIRLEAAQAEDNAMRTQMERDAPKEPEKAAEPAPTMQDIEALLVKFQQPLPKSMTITAPSGGVYDVAINAGAQ